VRKLPLLLSLFVLPLPAEAQFVLRFERRTRHTHLSIRAWYPVAPPCAWRGTYVPAVTAWPMPVAATGTVLYVPSTGFGPVGALPAPGPWTPPEGALPPAPGPAELAARYTRYAVPPPPAGAVLELRLAGLVEAGREAMKAGDAKRATAAFREAILLAPEEAPGRPPLEAWFGAALAAAGDARHADRALAAARGLVDLKDLFPSSDAFDKMLAALESGKAGHGRFASAYLRAATGQGDKAKTILDAILKDEPGHPAARALRAALP
jgi:hypothetical protein